jgi:hypothetical protein
MKYFAAAMGVLIMTAVLLAGGCCNVSDSRASVRSDIAEPDVLVVTEAAPAAGGDIGVTASSWEQKAHGGWADFPPENTLDGDLKTSWRAEGEGQWIQYDLRGVRRLTGVRVGFMGGDQRQYRLSILTSRTGAENDWTPAVEKTSSSGQTLEPELFRISPIEARYVRLVGHGNTNEQFAEWFNITVVEFVTE